MWRVVKTLRNLGNRFRSLYSSQPSSTPCDDCSTTSSNVADRSVVPTYPFTDKYRTNSNERKDGQEGCRGKRTCHNRPPTLEPSVCSLLEVLGWSTAALLGVQQYIGLRRRQQTAQEEITPKSGCTAGDIVSHFVFTTSRLPIQDNSFLLSVLPKNATTVQKELPIPSVSYDFNNFAGAHSELSSQSLKEDNTPLNEASARKTEADDAVTAAARELQAVTNLCVATIQNNVGIRLAQKDQASDALPYFLAGCELGYSAACFNAAVCYETGLGTKKDLIKAKELYEAAVEKGHIAAMYNLGVFYMEGIGNVSKDLHKSLDLFERAADAGLKEAQRAMGLHYIRSKEVDKAIPFLDAASKQKDPDAEYYLGLCYENGWGIDENMAKAADLYSKAAHQGHLDATYNLAVFYELGLGGIPQQLDTALDMYSKVAADGHTEAAARINYLEARKRTDPGPLDTELLTEPDLDRLPYSASAPELHLHTSPENISGTQLSKSNSAKCLRLAGICSTFSKHDDGSKENDTPMFQEGWSSQNEIQQSQLLQVPWIGV